ncbi:MAG TPA: AEC family transporter [Candidatus Saccharimonadales bacterium]|nr:AEC family transporter [Candidatus Saccharimonadales bacterium]
MLIFLTLFTKLIPLYCMILLGFLAGKYLRVQKESIALLLIYIIIPIVIFSNVATLKLSPSLIVIPIIFFILSCSICLMVFHFTKFVWKDTTRNLVAFTVATGNVGYFGLPVAIAIFGNSIIGYAALIILSLNLYQTSLGFFILARGKYGTCVSSVHIDKHKIII